MKIIFIILFITIVFSSSPPLPPSRYYVEFDFEVPQWTKSQYPRVFETVKMWYDGINNLQRIDFYGGQDQTFVKKISDKNYEVYHIIPRGNEKACVKGNLETSLISAFPSNLDSFSLVGKEVVGNTSCDVYNFNNPVNGATNNYTYYVSSSNGVPVQFNYIGFSSSMAGYLHSPNYDWFISNYTRYVPNYYNSSDFDIPSICNNVLFKNVMTPSQRLSHIFHFDVDKLFQEFVSQHKKEYISKEEFEIRKKNFLENLSKISTHRWNYNSGLHSHLLGVNAFADKSKNELKSSCYHKNEKILQEISNKDIYHIKSNKKLPNSVDWREKGAVSPIKDQGDCGSCWSFSATGSVESAHFIKNKEMLTASEQYLLDCTWPVGNLACDGGWPFASYDYVQNHNNGSWPSEKDYRYLMNPNFCKSVKGGITLLGYKKTKTFDENELMDAVANVGPVSVCVDSSDWTFYHSGVFDESTCSSNPNDIDHCVLAVGYGSDETGKDFWIIKNQWSEYWGEDGYIRLARGKNMCGVADDPVYPIVA